MFSKRKPNPIIVIMGIDGSGKTTQSRKLAENLSLLNYNVEYVRPVYLLLDMLPLQSRFFNRLSPRNNKTSIKKSITNKYSVHVKKLIIAIIGYFYSIFSYFFMKYYLSRKKIVICDRYFYQFFYDLFGNNSKFIMSIFPQPDLVFFLNGDLDLFYNRMTYSKDKEVPKLYYTNVIRMMKYASDKYDYIEIDPSFDKETISNNILGLTISYLEDYGHV